MKNYRDVANRVLARRDAAIRAEAKKRKRVIAGLAAGLPCLAVTATVAGLWIGGQIKEPQDPTEMPDYVTPGTDQWVGGLPSNESPDVGVWETEMLEPPIAAEPPIDDIIPVEDDFDYMPDVMPDTTVLWNGKRITAILYESIQTAAVDDTITVVLQLSQMPDLLAYTFKGKTLQAYKEEMIACYELEERLILLHKMGEVLQYGEALYTTGTPNGEKWTKGMYDEMVESIGKDLIETYIVNGVYQTAAVQKEQEAVSKQAEVAEELFADGQAAYETAACKRAADILAEAGHTVLMMMSSNALQFEATANELADLKLDSEDKWLFMTEYDYYGNFDTPDVNSSIVDEKFVTDLGTLPVEALETQMVVDE